MSSASSKERRVKTPAVFQMEATECGAASLSIILGYHGLFKPLEELRVACGVSRNGSVASLILRAAERYGLHGSGYKLPAEKLMLLPLPCIIHWDFSHFVVLEGKKRGKWCVNDPASGPIRYSDEEFRKHYTGIALAFEPLESFRPGGAPKGVLRTLLPLLGEVREAAVAIVWIGLLLALPSLLAPAMLRIFIDDVLGDKAYWLPALLLAYAAMTACKTLLVWLQGRATRLGGSTLAAENTMRMLRHMFRLPISFFMQRNSVTLQHQVAMNRPIAEAVFGRLAGNAVNCLVSVFFFSLMCTYSLVLSGIAAGTAALNFLALALLRDRRQTLAQDLQVENNKQLTLTLNGIAMIESLRAGGRENSFFNEWSGALSSYVRKRQAMQYSSVLSAALPSFLFGLNSVLILCFGAWSIIAGSMSLGSMMAFMALMGGFIAPINAIVADGAALQEMKGVVVRLEDALNYPAEQRFAEEKPALAEAEATVPGQALLTLENISFGYGIYDPPAVKDFSLTLEPGKWIALVGTSGSGKSTLAKLASGLYQPWEGRIKLNGHPLESYSASEWVRHIATVDQSIMLFSGTIRDNLTIYAESHDNSALRQALEDACLMEELGSRGERSVLEIPVQEGGSNFSGGQCQRIEIARALAKRAPILIMDEATSALDAATEMKIYEAVRRRGCSCLVIAHRLSTIRYCDEIIVLDKGLIAERGPHDRLMALGGIYTGLMSAQ